MQTNRFHRRESPYQLFLSLFQALGVSVSGDDQKSRASDERGLGRENEILLTESLKRPNSPYICDPSNELNYMKYAKNLLY